MIQKFRLGQRKIKGADIPAPLICLGFVNVGSLRTLRACSYVEGYTLALFEGPETVLLDRCVMHKYIFPVVCCDKTKTF